MKLAAVEKYVREFPDQYSWLTLAKVGGFAALACLVISNIGNFVIWESGQPTTWDWRWWVAAGGVALFYGVMQTGLLWMAKLTSRLRASLDRKMSGEKA